MAIEQDHAAQGGVWNTGWKRWEWRDEHDYWHRIGGPAVIYANGHQIWYRHGQRHRVDGPAVIEADGRQRWYQDDRLHRADGPAVIYPDGSSAWYVQGREITAEVLAWMRDNDVSLPFTEAQRAEFALRWL
jgi:hypothetical protein